MNDNSLVIDTRGLTKTFKGVNALQSLDLKVPKNSIFGFLGPNGAGKTTTIKLLLGLSRPTGGSATVFGLDTVRTVPTSGGVWAIWRKTRATTRT